MLITLLIIIGLVIVVMMFAISQSNYEIHNILVKKEKLDLNEHKKQLQTGDKLILSFFAVLFVSLLYLIIH